MPAKRKYNIKGTNDFLVLAGIFFFLCIWAVKDAWYPSPKVLKKHPVEKQASFEISGAVDKIYVEPGDRVSEKQVLASLRRDRLSVEFDEAKEVYTEARQKHAMMQQAVRNARNNGASDGGIEKMEQRLFEAEEAMSAALQKVNKLRVSVESTDLLSPSKGAIKQVLVESHSLVEAGEPAIVIDPKDHFYLFNKSLAIFSFFAFWIFLAIHILAR
jgi:multidrug resistance efflux pump